jgi:hypothetical protein
MDDSTYQLIQFVPFLRKRLAKAALLKTRAAAKLA